MMQIWREIYSHQKESDDAEALYIPCSYSDPDHILVLSGPNPDGYTCTFRYAGPYPYTATTFHGCSYGYRGPSASYCNPVRS